MTACDELGVALGGERIEARTVEDISAPAAPVAVHLAANERIGSAA